jgi:hypothetical protein
MYDANAKEIHRMELRSMSYAEIEALVNSKGFYRDTYQDSEEEADDSSEDEDAEEMLFYEDGAVDESYDDVPDSHEEL